MQAPFGNCRNTLYIAQLDGVITWGAWDRLKPKQRMSAPHYGKQLLVQVSYLALHTCKQIWCSCTYSKTIEHISYLVLQTGKQIRCSSKYSKTIVQVSYLLLHIGKQFWCSSEYSKTTVKASYLVLYISETIVQVSDLAVNIGKH